MERKLTHFSLFSGIGGIDLAAEWAGFKTVGQCEWADYPTKVLEKHWPDVERWRDIRTLTKESFYERTGRTTVDLLSGGFPCQDVSSAAGGYGKGLVDTSGTQTRSGLWFEMLRVISEIKPQWIVAENVAGLLSNDDGRTFETVITGLESENYQTIPILYPASNQGAAFEGKRVFIVAASVGVGNTRSSSQKLGMFIRKLVESEQKGSALWGETERRIIQTIRNKETLSNDIRSDYGFPDWVDRLKCLGNAVVPQQVYPILQTIADIELQQYT